MSNEEANQVLEELHEVRPEKLNDKAKRLFEAIMTIADERDEAWSELKNSIPKKTYNQTKKTLKGIIAQKNADLYEANNRINDLLDLDTQKDKLIDEIILYIIRHNYFDTTEFDKNIIPTIENIRKHFEERCE